MKNATLSAYRSVISLLHPIAKSTIQHALLDFGNFKPENNQAHSLLSEVEKILLVLCVRNKISTVQELFIYQLQIRLTLFLILTLDLF